MIDESQYQNPILTENQVVDIIKSYKQRYSILDKAVAYRDSDDGFTYGISLYKRLGDQHNLFGYYKYQRIALIDRKYVSGTSSFKMDLEVFERNDFYIYYPDKLGDEIYLRSLNNCYDNLNTLEILSPKLPIHHCPEDLKNKLIKNSLTILSPIVESIKQTQTLRNFKEGWIFYKLKDLENLEIRKLWSDQGYYARPQQFFGLLGIVGDYTCFDPALLNI